MWRAKLWNKSVSRVELDQRAREVRLRLEQVDGQAAPLSLQQRHFRQRVARKPD